MTSKKPLEPRNNKLTQAIVNANPKGRHNWRRTPLAQKPDKDWKPRQTVFVGLSEKLKKKKITLPKITFKDADK